MTRQQRENLIYVSGKLHALKTIIKNREISLVLSDIFDTIGNMLDADEVKDNDC